MLTLNVNDTVARVRKVADLETSDESKSVVRDAEIVEHLNDGYRELWDSAAELAPGLVTTSTTLASPYTLPADYYQPRGFDLTTGGRTWPLLPYAHGNRGIYQFGSLNRPRWHISVADNKVRWQPSEFSSDVTMWYIPTAPALAAASTYNAWHGWDQWLIQYALRAVRDKQEYDLVSVERALERAGERVRRALIRAGNPPGPIEDITTLPDSHYRGV